MASFPKCPSCGNRHCPSCGNGHFESSPETPPGAMRTLLFVRCASCGTVVGVAEYEHTNDLLRKLARGLGHPLT
jgi:hypothetical protein